MESMHRIFFILLICSMAQASLLHATNRMPWTEDKELELHPRFEYLFQHYNKVDSSSGSERRNSYDHFYTLGLSGSYEPWSAELEVTAAATRHRSFGLDNFRITGKYQWSNDIIGDCYSITTGATYIKATKIALKDIGSFHHGRNEAELFVSIGKEQSCYDTWATRWWGVGIFGVADHGSPWWRAIAAWEKNINQNLFFKFFLDGLFGMGGNSIDLDDSFGGYGSIAHRSVDIGVGVSRWTDCWGIWHADYIRRVYAYNFPKNANLFKISVMYPIGL